MARRANEERGGILIYPDDTASFSEIMDTTWQSLSRSTLPDKNTKKYWFGKLQGYALGDVAQAFDKYIMSDPRSPNGTLILPSVNDIAWINTHIQNQKSTQEKL